MSDDPEMTDPEMSYRRGYQHGAKELFDAIAHHLPGHERLILSEWIEQDIFHWRLAAMRGESVRKTGPDGDTAFALPPTGKLSRIRAKV